MSSTGGGWGRGGTPGVVARVPGAVPGERVVRFGGFWARIGAAFVDGLVANLLGLILVPFVIVGLFVARSTNSCRDVRGSGGVLLGRECSGGSPALFLFICAVGLVVVFYLWFRLFPLRLGRSGATLGMEALGLRLVDARRYMMVSTGAAFVRYLMSGLVGLVLSAPFQFLMWWRLDTFAFDFTGDTEQLEASLGSLTPGSLWVSVFTLSYLLPMLSPLWFFVDRRYQTLYDKFSGTVVVRA